MLLNLSKQQNQALQTNKNGVLVSEFDLYLSYSGRKTYKACPSSYNYRYIIKEPVIRDSRSAMFGSIIGKVLEWFYNKRLWAEDDPIASAMSRIDDAIDTIFFKENFDRVSDPAFVNLLRRDLSVYLPRAIENIRLFNLHFSLL